jgi:carboxypeptidase Taq
MNLEIFYKTLSDIYTLNCVRSLLDWDQQVNLPPAGAAGRAQQLEMLSLLVHQLYTDPKFAALVDELSEKSAVLADDDRVSVREIKRNLDRQRKLPSDFVAEKSRITSLCYTEWTKARPANNFKAVQAYLEQIIELSRRECELVGYKEHPYDALLDDYEPYATLSQVKPLLLDLGEELAKLVPRIEAKTAGASVPNGVYPEELQRELCSRVLADMGFRFDRGRLDKTHHPFECSLGTDDIRITTRFDSGNYLSALATALHEGGHAIYEQNLPARHRGTPLGSPVSLGIHESQSRLWENIIGRSRPFAEYLWQVLAEVMPEESKLVSPEDLWRSLNQVKPTLIRVEADEVTYSLHVVIRMLLEEQLISGALSVSELPGAWDDMYQKYLGIRPAGDKEGVLQDVHWYSGMVGYFPTYALGNLYGALFFRTAQKEIPDLDQLIQSGRFGMVVAWLREKIYQHGMRYHGLELAQRISGEALSVRPFLEYLRGKHGV